MRKITVWSGAASGVDQAALLVASVLGLQTGGFVTRGCRTQSGFRPELIQRYHLTEIDSQNYKDRTWLNVQHTDATLRIFYYKNSPGEICTLKAIKIYNKPHLDVDLENPISPRLVARWIEGLDIRILNVAGNSESSFSGIGKIAEKYLMEVFTELLWPKK